MMTDCNTRGLMGHFTAHDLPGWGYNYYQLDNVVGPVSTMMACPDNNKTEAFVPVHGDNFMLRYNSQLPIVVYAPNGIEVRYRIWSASEPLQSALEQ
jgi:ecotin